MSAEMGEAAAEESDGMMDEVMDIAQELPALDLDEDLAETADLVEE